MHHHRRPDRGPAQRPHRTHRRHLRLRRHRRHHWSRGPRRPASTSLIACAAFPARLGDSESFRDLVKAMDSALDLRHHRPGTSPSWPPACWWTRPVSGQPSPPPPPPPAGRAALPRRFALVFRHFVPQITQLLQRVSQVRILPGHRKKGQLTKDLLPGRPYVVSKTCAPISPFTCCAFTLGNPLRGKDIRKRMSVCG